MAVDLGTVIVTVPDRLGGDIAIAYNYTGTVTASITASSITSTGYYRFLFNNITPTAAQLWTYPTTTSMSFTLTQPVPEAAPVSCQMQGADAAGGPWFNTSTGSFTITRAPIPVPTAISAVTTTTPAASTSITITTSGGTGSYQYSINGTAWQPSNIFSGVTWGSNITIYSRSLYVYNSVTYAGSAFSAAYSVGYATGTIDTAITLTTPYKDGTIVPATTTSVGLTVAAGNTITEYKAFKDGIDTAQLIVGNGTITLSNGTFPLAGGLPVWGGGGTFPGADGASLYEIKARLATSLGGNPSTAYTACTGTVNGTGTVINWLMYRYAYPPTISATLTQTFTTTATATVTSALVAGSGTLQYSLNNSTWQTSSSFTGLTRSVSQPFYSIVRGLSVNFNTDSTSVTTSINTFNQPDTLITITGSVITSPTIGDNDAADKIINMAGDSIGTTYRLLLPADPLPVVDAKEGNGSPASFFTITNFYSDLPPTGSTYSYKVVALVQPANGGQGIETDCPGTTFTITRTDVPNAFTFTDLTPLVSTVVTTYVQITGLSSTATVSRISGTAEFSVSATTTPGTYGTTNTTITNNQYLHLRVTSGPTVGNILSTEMDVNTVRDTWTVTSTAPDTNPEGFLNLAANVSNAPVSTTYYATFAATAPGTTTPGTGYTLGDINTPISITATNGQFITTSNSTWRTTDASVAVGQVVYFRATSSASFSTPITHTLAMGSGTARSFTTTTLTPDTNPEGFLNLAGNVTAAAANTYYYATFSTTAAGLTGPGSAYTLNDINTSISVTASNGDYSTNGTTWQATGSVAAGATVYFRGLTSTSSGTLTTHTLTLGTGTPRAFTTTTAALTTLPIGVVSRTPVGDLIGAYSGNIVVSFTIPDANQRYKITRTSGTVTDLVTGATLGTSSLTFTELPAEGVSNTYQIYTRKETAQGGDNVWKATTGTGIGTAFTITKILQPTVKDNQVWDTTTNTSTISHNIQLKVAGIGGTLEHAISTSATYNTNLIGTWQISSAFNLTRGSSYFLWARRSTDSGDADATNASVTVAAYSPPAPYGLRVYGTDGATIVLDISSRIGRTLVKGGPISVAAGVTSAAIPVVGLDTADNSHIAVLIPDASTYLSNPADITVNYAPTSTFTITNNTTDPLSFYYYAFNSGQVV